MITTCPLELCLSVCEYFKCGGKVEIPRPELCPFGECRLGKPMWRNGSYVRQVIYWGLLFIVSILRFRCRRCGKSVSCPYAWLVPYRRFSAEVVASGIESYAVNEISYRNVTATQLSDPEFIDPAMDIRQFELYAEMLKEGGIKLAARRDECHPAHTTVFYWVAHLCSRTEQLLQQIQKELVRRQRSVKELPSENVVENPNSHKAQSNEKRRLLDQLSFATIAGEILVKGSKRVWERLRSYFLAIAESRKDLLTDASVRLSTTHTFELVIC